MFLVINTSIKNEMTVGYFFKNGLGLDKVVPVPGRDLLGCIQNVISENSLTIKDVQGIAVVFGKGTFTASRIAATVANTLAFANSIPVVSLHEQYVFAELATLFENAPVGRYISAQYGAEPRIGV